MKKGTKVFLAAIVFIVIAVTAFCVWQKENIRAVYMYLSAQGESAVLSGAEVLEIPVLLEEKGESDEDTAGSDAGKSVKRSTRAPSEAESRDAGITVKEEKTYLQKCREELYACESSLVSRVGGMKEEVLAEWRALPAEERTNRKKREMIISGVGRCLSLEGEIDGKVKGIIAKYKALAQNAGESTAEISALWDEYKAKKASTKAYYLNKYLG